MAQSFWYEKESEHFKVIYRITQENLVDHILFSAENSLDVLMKLFDYKPSEKIIINTYDAYDYGFGSATTVPENYIRLEIEPFEPGYESVLYDDRFQWLLSHELVHIVLNDQSSGIESFARKLFSKVAPEQVQPLTIPFSFLTNYSRYTPRWYQEGIAVLMETIESGGYGRVLGNFDEMYFRSMVQENQKFPTPLELDAIQTHNSFLLENLFYIYGERFFTYLVDKYGFDKVVEWVKTSEHFYQSYTGRFYTVFKEDLDDAWSDFINSETQFQKHNLEKISSAPLTKIDRLTDHPFGWVSQPYYSPKNNSMIFAYHKSHHLATLQMLDLKSGKSKELLSLPTPSMLQVSSITYDDSLQTVFYTTNNNQLYRDIWSYNLTTGETEELFHDCRVGHLAISSHMHELWGVQHALGKAVLVYSQYPFKQLFPVIGFDIGDEIQNLSIDSSGTHLSAVLHRSNGVVSIIVSDLENLKKTGRFQYTVLTDQGSPDYSSWSPDGKHLFWNTYLNGVSNIYRYDFDDNSITALSNTRKGLFKPVCLSPDSIFAFEFSTNGFIPCIIKNEPAKSLPAIQYYGQTVIDRHPDIMKYTLPFADSAKANMKMSSNEEYNSLSNQKLLTLIPMISGFQKQKVLGLFTHISDPLLIHDLTMEIGYSPFNEMSVGPKFHFNMKYEYKRQYKLAFGYNAPDFYDLFNTRKRAMIGTKLTLGNTHYWVYDNPLKITQNSELALYTGVEFINDNLIRVSQPDFFVAQTNYNYSSLRRSIGSSDFEEGNLWDATVMVFGSNPSEPQYSAQLYSDFSHYSTWFAPHNVLLMKLGAGYHFKNDDLYQSKFFFGGFGNREVENVDVKQYRKVFRLPGIPMYDLDADSFVKLMVENNFPPVRFGNLGLGEHYLSHIDFSIYSQFLVIDSSQDEVWTDVGGQINFVFKHWFNLESTFSAGIANAWHHTGRNWEWFLSYKLLRN